MKKTLLILLFLSLIIIPTLSAVELKFTKNSSEFKQGETLISYFSGNFLDQIISENVLFYEDHTRVPFDFSISKINNDFYIYTLLQDKEFGNYSIHIEGVRY